MVGLIGSLLYRRQKSIESLCRSFLAFSCSFDAAFPNSKDLFLAVRNSTLNSIYLFLGAPFVVILGWLFLNEMPTAFQMLGIVFIVGSAVSSYFIISKLKKEPLSSAGLLSMQTVKAIADHSV